MWDSVGACKCRRAPSAFVFSRVFDGNVHFEASRSPQPQKLLRYMYVCMFLTLFEPKTSAKASRQNCFKMFTDPVFKQELIDKT